MFAPIRLHNHQVALRHVTVWKVLVVRVKMNFNVGIGSCLCNACFSLLDCVCFMYM